jgi:hypothetical protein
MIDLLPQDKRALAEGLGVPLNSIVVDDKGIVTVKVGGCEIKPEINGELFHVMEEKYGKGNVSKCGVILSNASR